MARHVEDVQECRELFHLQLSKFSELKEADAGNMDVLEHLEEKWTTAAQDAATVIQMKEAQLQLVADYCRQLETVEATMDSLTADLEAVMRSPQESSHKETKQLCSLQRSMEENRTTLGELIVTCTKLYLHLSQSNQKTALTEQKNLQRKWKTLERAVESALHHANAHSHQSRNLMSNMSALRDHVEMTRKDLEAIVSSVSPWNCREAQQLMKAHAEVKAAQQQYLHLQQLSEELLPSSRWEVESKEIHQGLQEIKDKLHQTEELLSSQTKNSSNPIMEKIIAVMRDGLAWAKRTESHIEGRRRRVPLLPEEVHRQLRDLKKMQSEVLSKQAQLESLVEEVTELLPQLDQDEEVPMVNSSLECLEELSKSTAEKLSKTMKEIEFGLQTREKLSEQMADLDSWIVAHLQSVALRSADNEVRSHAELDRNVRHIQETLAEAEKHAAICEALSMKSKDIALELSIPENCLLFDKIRNFQEDIIVISSNEKADKEELEELMQTRDSKKRELITVEQSLRQMLVDLTKYRFPITGESLQALEPYKHMILELTAQVDLLIPWIPNEKTSELNSVISDLQKKILVLERKGREHELYLDMRQCVEDLREIILEQIQQTKEESRALEERYKMCHTLLIQFPLVNELFKEALSKLEMISADLYPSQLTAEQQRLKQTKDRLDTCEMTLHNNLRVIEWDVIKGLDLEKEKKAAHTFLSSTHQELLKLPLLEPNQKLIDRQYHKIVSLKKIVESKMRVLEILEQKKESKERRASPDLLDLKSAVLRECDSQTEKIVKAKECLINYTCAVREIVQFLQDIEVSQLPPQGPTGLCWESLEGTQQALASLKDRFQICVEELQKQVPLPAFFCPQTLEHLQENVLSQLLVRMSTIQAKANIRLDCLSSCAEKYRNYIRSQEEIIQSATSAESNLLQIISQKVTCLADCTDQEGRLSTLSEEMQLLQRRLEDLREWCPERSCCRGREATVTAICRRVSQLCHCTQELAARSKQRAEEWINVTDSVDKASVLLEQVEAELPDESWVKASTEELHDLLQSWEQYQHRLECEHRALSGLELRTARLLAVPAHLEQAPPTPICQQLQVMQGRYSSVKQKSREGLLAARLELEDREKIREELQDVRVWLDAVEGFLSEMEQGSSSQEPQEVCSHLRAQKTLLQRIMENLKIKYSDAFILVPAELESQLQEVTKSLQQVEVKVCEAVERSGPLHRLGAKLAEIESGLRLIQTRLEERSPTAAEAKVTQKRVWDELDLWHSRLAALEVDMQDLESPGEALMLTERLVEVQQLHSQLAKHAEQRTTLLSKMHTWLQEHEEMLNSSRKWMSEAQSWLASPCTYTSAKCLSSHVHALQLVLDDAAQIQTTLQNFSSVLTEMSQVCDVTALQEQLDQADLQVATVKDGFTAPLAQLEHAAAEVDAIEREVRRMESDVAEIKILLTSPEAFPSPRENKFKMIEQRIHLMRKTVAEIQKCKPGLCLPEKAEETLAVFTVVGQLQTLLLELEKKVPAMFIQQPPTPVQTKPSAKLQKSTSAEAEGEQGQIRIAHFEEDILKRSGGMLQTVEETCPERGQSSTVDGTQRGHQGGLQADEATEKTGREELSLEDVGGGVMWWLWDAFLGASPEEPVAASGGSEAAPGQTAHDQQDVDSTDTVEASSPEALAEPLGTVTTQSLSDSMVDPASTVNVSKADSGPQRCTVS